MNVMLRHARGKSGESERDVETILTEAAIGKRRLWASSLLFAELRPSAFVGQPFPNLAEFTSYIRAIATFVTPDPNTMLRAARLRDVKWRRPVALRRSGEVPWFMSLVDAIHMASALWVKETLGVSDLEFLTFDDPVSDEAEPERRLSLLRLQDYAEDLPTDSDGLAAVQLRRVQPHLKMRPARQPIPAD